MHFCVEHFPAILRVSLSIFLQQTFTYFPTNLCINLSNFVALPESKPSFAIDVFPQLVASLENNAPGPCSTWAFFLSSSQTSWVEMNWNTSVFPQYHCCYQLPVTSTSYQVLSTIAVTNLFIRNKCFVVYFLSLLNTKIHF